MLGGERNRFEPQEATVTEPTPAVPVQPEVDPALEDLEPADDEPVVPETDGPDDPGAGGSQDPEAGDPAFADVVIPEGF